MTEEQKATLQAIWETLNGVVYDLEVGDPDDALISNVQDCINRLEAMGIGE